MMSAKVNINLMDERSTAILDGVILSDQGDCPEGLSSCVLGEVATVGLGCPGEKAYRVEDGLKLGTPEFAARCKEVDSRSFGYRLVKRIFDIVFSLCVIVAGFIPGLILSIAIMIDTKGSPIYSQVRVGRGGKLFRIYKFRTMVADSDDVAKYLSGEKLDQWKRERKVENDPRITPLGRKLRHTSLDEMPNFLNVLIGDIPSRILKTRRGFSVKKPGAFALPANLARTRIAVSLQVRAAICHIVGVPQNLFEYFIAGYGKVREVFAKLSSRFDFPHLDRSLPVPCDGLFV